jgi:Transposase and inactivated derivatives
MSKTAFSNFFAGRAKYPTFKKKHRGGSAEFTKSAFRWKEGKLYLAKCHEPLDIRWSRQLPTGAEPSTITIRLNPARQWYVSIRFDDPRNLNLKPTKQSVGIDLGLSSLVTLSTGEKVAPPKYSLLCYYGIQTIKMRGQRDAYTFLRFTAKNCSCIPSGRNINPGSS